jgi:hypothetical protein
MPPGCRNVEEDGGQVSFSVLCSSRWRMIKVVESCSMEDFGGRNCRLRDQSVMDTTSNGKSVRRACPRDFLPFTKDLVLSSFNAGKLGPSRGDSGWCK